MRFIVPDVGTVDASNAVFMYLERLLPHGGKESVCVNRGGTGCRLGDIPVGGFAFAYFATGQGDSAVKIQRVA